MEWRWQLKKQRIRVQDNYFLLKTIRYFSFWISKNANWPPHPHWLPTHPSAELFHPTRVFLIPCWRGRRRGCQGPHLPLSPGRHHQGWWSLRQPDGCSLSLPCWTVLPTPLPLSWDHEELWCWYNEEMWCKSSVHYENSVLLIFFIHSMQVFSVKYVVLCSVVRSGYLHTHTLLITSEMADCKGSKWRFSFWLIDASIWKKIHWLVFVNYVDAAMTYTYFNMKWKYDG